MAGIFDHLQDVFLTLFLRDPQAVEKRRQLRSLYNKARQARPPYFRRSAAALLPALAETVDQLMGLLRPLREIFDRTVSQEDPKLAQRYVDFTLIDRLPERLKATYDLLGFGALKQRVLSAPDPAAELAAAEAEVAQLLSHLADPGLQSFERDYSCLQRLVSLCRHDLSRLLSQFRPRSQGQEAPYQPAAGEEALPELLDLYFVLSGVELSAGVQRCIASLLERLTRERAEEAQKRLQGVFQQLRVLLDERLQPGTLLVLIRLIQRDPHSVPQTMRDEGAVLEGFRNRWSIGFQRSRDHVRWLLKEQEVAGDLKTLFGEAELLPIEGYHEYVDQKLQQHDLEGFVHIRPLRIIKSYVLMHFERGLREPVKRLIVEGKFENRIFQNMLTNTFFGCEAVAERIREFEQSLQADGPQSARRLPKYLELLSQGKPVLGIVGAVLEDVEKASGKLVEDGASLFHNLSVVLLEILNDAKQKNPAQISNIKSLGGRRSQEHLARLASGYNHLLLFTRIMQSFTTAGQKDYATAGQAD